MRPLDSPWCNFSMPLVSQHFRHSIREESRSATVIMRDPSVRLQECDAQPGHSDYDRWEPIRRAARPGLSAIARILGLESTLVALIPFKDGETVVDGKMVVGTLELLPSVDILPVVTVRFQEVMMIF